MEDSLNKEISIFQTILIKFNRLLRRRKTDGVVNNKKAFDIAANCYFHN